MPVRARRGSESDFKFRFGLRRSDDSDAGFDSDNVTDNLKAAVSLVSKYYYYSESESFKLSDFESDSLADVGQASLHFKLF